MVCHYHEKNEKSVSRDEFNRPQKVSKKVSDPFMAVTRGFISDKKCRTPFEGCKGIASALELALSEQSKSKGFS